MTGKRCPPEQPNRGFECQEPPSKTAAPQAHGGKDSGPEPFKARSMMASTVRRPIPALPIVGRSNLVHLPSDSTDTVTKNSTISSNGANGEVVVSSKLTPVGNASLKRKGQQDSLSEETAAKRLNLGTITPRVSITASADSPRNGVRPGESEAQPVSSHMDDHAAGEALIPSETGSPAAEQMASSGQPPHKGLDLPAQQGSSGHCQGSPDTKGTELPGGDAGPNPALAKSQKPSLQVTPADDSNL